MVLQVFNSSVNEDRRKHPAQSNILQDKPTIPLPSVSKKPQLQWPTMTSQEIVSQLTSRRRLVTFPTMLQYKKGPHLQLGT